MWRSGKRQMTDVTAAMGNHLTRRMAGVHAPCEAPWDSKVP